MFGRLRVGTTARLAMYAILTVLASGLTGGLTGRASAQPVRVVTTTSVFADMIASVGGERVQVTSLVPTGADPHSWDPTPREIRSVSNADIFVYNGHGFEGWAPRLIEGAGRPGLVALELSAGLQALAAGEGHGDDAHGHQDEEGNPHFWLDVTYAIEYVRRIEAALAAYDPAGAAYYSARASAYVQELEALDRWIFEQIAQIPPERRVLVAYHNAYAYMARRYGLEAAGFLVENPDREPAAQGMARLVRLLRERQVPAVFVEPQIDSRLAETIAREAGVRIGVLYTDSLTDAVPTYVAMMRANAETLVSLLR